MDNLLSTQVKGGPDKSTGSQAGGVLQRKCACGNHTVAGGRCGECEKNKTSLQHKATDQRVASATFLPPDIPGMQRKLSIGSTTDPLEREADQVADHVLAASKHAESRQTPPRIQRYAGSAAAQIESAADSVDRVLAGSGRPLDSSLRHDMEHRFGRDFSRVRVHSGGVAEQSAREVNAQAFTVGHNIVFGAGRFMPGTPAGRRLLAHELTHVVQQNSQLSRTLQRCPDAATDAIYDTKAAEVKAHPVFALLPPVETKDQPGSKVTVDTIVGRAKPRPNCLYYMDKLKLLFDTPVKPKEKIAQETSAATVTAAEAERQRLAEKSANAKQGLEKRVAEGGTFVKKKGKFGGGSYFVDARDPNNIIVKAKILLQKKGTATDDEVKDIISMQDAIEKLASTAGYIVSLEFVDVADADTFTVNIEPGEWAVSTNWAGGDPKRFAHELHHMFAFELDRYDYIEAHSANDSMQVSNRVLWFGNELKKPAGYNNPTSIMSSASSPNDDDVCTVGDLPVAACITARQKVKKAGLAIWNAYRTPEERILNTIQKFLAADVDTMMAILRDIFKWMFGLPEAARVLKRLNNKEDTLGKVFQKLPADKQSELLKIISP